MKQLTKVLAIIFVFTVFGVCSSMLIETKDWIFGVFGFSALIVGVILSINLKNN